MVFFFWWRSITAGETRRLPWSIDDGIASATLTPFALCLCLYLAVSLSTYLSRTLPYINTSTSCYACKSPSMRTKLVSVGGSASAGLSVCVSYIFLLHHARTSMRKRCCACTSSGGRLCERSLAFKLPWFIELSTLENVSPCHISSNSFTQTSIWTRCAHRLHRCYTYISTRCRF